MKDQPEQDSFGNYTCPQCGERLKLIPAGTSKTKVDQFGNPKKFPAFYVCPVKECGYSWNPPKPREDKSDMSAFAGDDTTQTLRTELNIIKNSIPKLVREEMGKAFYDLAGSFADTDEDNRE